MKLFDWHSEKRRKHCTAIIVAAGKATRMRGIDKTMVRLLGQPVIAHTIRAFEESESIDEIICVVRPDQIVGVETMVCNYEFSKVKKVIAGGETRMESVVAGLKACSPDTILVAIQDGARPLVSSEVIARAVGMALTYHAAAPSIAVKDTIKVADESGRVVTTPSRKTLRAVQTPQVFDRDLLMVAWERARKEELDYTDDCSAMEGLGVHVYLTEGSEENIKITTPLDLKIAEIVLKERMDDANRTRV